MVAVAVTEPDYGSDVGAVKVTATPAEGVDGAPGYVINGVKTWCTFAARADVLMLLAAHRSRPSAGPSRPEPVHRPQAARRRDTASSSRRTTAASGRTGRMEGRPIDTIGYRGMHSYEIALEDWWVPADHLIGGEEGLGRGFYLTMQGFENGRLQTAAAGRRGDAGRYEAAVDYARNRTVFGSSIVDYQLTQGKLGRMAMLIQAGRQFAYHVATLMAKGHGTMEASMVKAYVCKAAEWVTREAMQIHGGFGYAEEYPVSRLFVDARVLSIFEGADETLCLKSSPPPHRVGQSSTPPFESWRGQAGTTYSTGSYTRSANERMRSKSASGGRRRGRRGSGADPAALAPPTSMVTESPTYAIRIATARGKWPRRGRRSPDRAWRRRRRGCRSRSAPRRRDPARPGTRRSAAAPPRSGRRVGHDTERQPRPRQRRQRRHARRDRPAPQRRRPVCDRAGRLPPPRRRRARRSTTRTPGRSSRQSRSSAPCADFTAIAA